MHSTMIVGGGVAQLIEVLG